MIINRFFTRTFLKTESKSFRLLQNNLTRVDYKIITICVIVALSLTGTHYFGDYRFLVSVLQDLKLNQLAQQIDSVMSIHPNAQLFELLYWANIIILFYFVIPTILILYVFKEKLTDYGLGFNKAFNNYSIYVCMLIIMMPLVFYFSGTESFLSSYPFYQVTKGESLYAQFLVWELFYFMQFFAIEFFFRGFILHGTKHRFGFYAIFVMMIPYCMIHFGKPIVETIAAIIAGIILGILSLKSKSIWLGVALHCSVALMMDLSVLYRKGILFDQSGDFSSSAVNITY